MKRVLCLLLALCLAVGLCTLPATAASTASGTCGAKLNWALKDGVLTLSGSGPMTDYASELYVPWSEYAFEIRTLVVGDEVTSLCDRAFVYCYKLAEVRLGVDSRLAKIGAGAFWGCTALRTLTLPAGLTSLGEGAFSGCGALTLRVAAGNPAYQTVGDALLTADGKTLLRYPAAATAAEYAVPETVTALADEAFYGCTALTAVTLPAALETVGDNAFNGCTGLRRVDFGTNSRLRTLGRYAFSGCEKLGSLCLPAGLREIGLGAFLGCAALTVVELPAQVQTLGAMAFASCPALRCVTLGGSVREIGQYAFARIDEWDDKVAVTSFAPSENYMLWCPQGSTAAQYAADNGIPCTTLRATRSLSHFTRAEDYVSGRFADVDETAWYGVERQGVIAAACELGIMDGMGDGGFAPEGRLRLAEVLKMAAVVHSRYNGRSGEIATSGSPWYADSVRYALDYGLIAAGQFSDYTAYATRAEVAVILVKALGGSELAAIRPSVSFADVAAGADYAAAVNTLARAGVLLGDGDRFRPDDPISRAEAAAVLTRLILPETRAQ